MSLRNEWEFEYTAGALAKAAKAQLDYRTARVTFWENKKTEVIERIKASGLTVTEALSEKMSYSTRNDRGAQVVVDEQMQADLDECVNKIRGHRGMVQQYEGWVQILEGNAEARVKLQHEDWLFFFGK